MLSSAKEQNQRLVEHFSEALNQSNPDSLFDFTNENDIDGNNSNITLNDMTRDELSYSIKTLENNKASGIDNLPVELFKHCADVIIEKFTEQGIAIWSSEEVPKNRPKDVL